MTDLKTQNEKNLMVLLLVALIPFYLAIVALYQEELWNLAKNQTWQAFASLAAIGAGPVVCLRIILRLIVDNVSPHWKERLAHLRWHHPLPGGRADKLIQSDSRIDIGSLPPEIHLLLDESMTPKERNSHWYTRVYRPVRESSAVSNTHRRYLLYREAATGAFIVFWVTVLTDLVSRIAYGFPLMVWPAYLVSASYVLLLIGAANQAGNRMVTGAIANHINMPLQGDAE